MNKRLLLPALFLLFSGLLSETASQQPAENNSQAWWQSGPWQRPQENPDLEVLPLVMVRGNKFVNERGDTLLLRGLAISDPDKLESQGYWKKFHFEKVKEMGATVVRIPVHPVAWRERTPEGYLVLLDQVAQWCTELGLYIMIDWHSIGNLGMELFQNPMYNTTRQETYQFWRTIASHFQGHNTLAFYEIFNEPTLYRGQLGSMTWSEWREINENIIRLIRSYDPDPIPLVAGFDGPMTLPPCYPTPSMRRGSDM
jgi:aryl-phospho-beta-D-glucosidase BglC (GH1 family)